MPRFDKRGMMVMPNPSKEDVATAEKVLVVQQVFCPNGDNLINDRAIFNGYPGVMVRLKQGDNAGLVALSPIYGQNARVSLDIDLTSGETTELFCPTCDSELPAYAKCSCGAELKAFFLSTEASYSDCLGVCSRVDCFNSKIISHGELISLSRIDYY